MSKLKIEHGASKVRLVQLKTNIEDGISTDIDLMCHWSDNDRRYIVNELLRFALAQEEDFLKYKAGLPADQAKPANSARSTPAPIRQGSDTVPKPEPAPISRAETRN